MRCGKLEETGARLGDVFSRNMSQVAQQTDGRLFCYRNETRQKLTHLRPYTTVVLHGGDVDVLERLTGGSLFGDLHWFLLTGYGNSHNDRHWCV